MKTKVKGIVGVLKDSKSEMKNKETRIMKSDTDSVKRAKGKSADKAVVSNDKNNNKKGKKDMKSNKHLITMDDINAIVFSGYGAKGELANSKKNGETLFNFGVNQLDAKNYKEAYRLFEKGAECGDTDCQHNLAVMLINGDGCRKNYKRGKLILEQASKNGNPNADFTLGLMYSKGMGVQKDYDRSLKLIMGAAEKGSDFAIEFWEEVGKGEGKMEKNAEEVGNAKSNAVSVVSETNCRHEDTIEMGNEQ